MLKKRLKKKSCSRCKKEKVLSEFCKGRSKFGRASWCKNCVAEKKREDRRDPSKKEETKAQYQRDRTRASWREWRRKDVLSGRSAERAQKSSKAYYERNREKILERQRKSRSSPQRKHRRKCNQLISLMVYFEMLTRAPCQICGETEDIQAAHRSYDDPLDIFWACAMHHRQYDHGWIDEYGEALK